MSWKSSFRQSSRVSDLWLKEFSSANQMALYEVWLTTTERASSDREESSKLKRAINKAKKILIEGEEMILIALEKEIYGRELDGDHVHHRVEKKDRRINGHLDRGSVNLKIALIP